MKFFNKETKDVKEENNNIEGTELEFNKKNREDYEKLMNESSTQLDGYWDSNNPIVRLILLALGVVIVGGSVFYILTYLGIK